MSEWGGSVAPPQPADDGPAEDLDEAISELTERLAAGTSDDAIDAAALGWALADRYVLRGDEADRDGAITWLRQACDGPDPPAGSDPLDELKLAMLMIERGDERRDAAEITAAIEYAQHSLAGLDGGAYAYACYALGLGHFVRAGIVPAPGELMVAIGHLREASARLPDGDPGRADIDARLGVALTTRVLGGPAADGADLLDEAFRLLTGAGPSIAPDDPFRVRARYWLAIASALRFIWYAGSDTNAHAALSEFQVVLQDPAVDVPMADVCHILAAALLLYRSAPDSVRSWSAVPDPAHLTRLFAESPVRTAPDAARSALDHLDRVSDVPAIQALASLRGWLRGAANLALGRPGLPGGEIDAAVAAFEEALRLVPDGTPGAGELRGMLGLLYGAAEARDGNPATPGRSVDALVAAARQLGDQHPMLPLLQGMLGGAVGIPLGERRPSHGESVAAIGLLETILDEIPADHPARAEVLIRLGGLLIGRAFSLDGSLARLQKLRRQLDEVIARPAVSQLNETVNHVLLGMAEGVQGLLEPDPVLVRTGVDRIKRAAVTAPAQGPIADLIHLGLIALLCQCYSQMGELEYLDAAMYYAGQAVEAPDGAKITADLQFAARSLLAFGSLARHPGTSDPGQFDVAIERLETLLTHIPEGHPLRLAVAGDVQTLRVMRGGLGVIDGDLSAVLRNPQRIAEAADATVAVARETPQGDPFYALNLGAAGSARAMQGVLLRNHRVASEGIALLGEACAAAQAVPEQRRRLLTMLAFGLRMRYDLTRDRSDLTNMISRLEEARRLAEDDEAGKDMAEILYCSALGHHERNDPNLRDHHRAVVLGLSALRERSAIVLLQSTTDRAFDAALAAAGEAADVARWCLAAGNSEAAVEALERGRGMVLHAAVADASVPLLLREGGHEELAREWGKALAVAGQAGPSPWDMLPSIAAAQRMPRSPAAEMTQFPEVRTPDDLRYRIQKALEGTRLERLLAPPPLADIVKALQGTGARALVYLLPQDGPSDGLALIVHDTGAISEITLRELTTGSRGPLAGYAQTQRDLTGAQTAPDEERARWQRALGQLCDWAWTAAMERVLAAVARGPQERPRLVVVPVGGLSLVPWHAARRPAAGGALRYACQDAVISYAASARQFTEACRNGHRPWRSAAAVVRVPGSRLLYFASKEAQEIYQRHYADGVLLGGPDRHSLRATAENVRNLLPRPGAAGVSLLHLGCHAEAAPRPVDGRLLLEDGQTLSMRDILQQARARPRDTPGCLVILAACGSDLSSAHHDEALTLASSFLAAGAIGVIGTRWPVADFPTRAFMIMFHHYLNSGYDDPPTALRAAQAWMLNPERAYPRYFPPKAAEMAGLAGLAGPACWAAFTYQGQ